MKIINKHITLNLYNSLIFPFLVLERVIKKIYMLSETTTLQINYLLSPNIITTDLIVNKRQIKHQTGRVYLHNNSVSSFYSHKY